MNNISKFTLLSLIFSFFTVEPVLANDKVISLSPAANWNIDYADDSCTLGRKFSTGDKHITLYITRFEPENKFELVLSGNLIETSKLFSTSKIQFGEFEGEQEHVYYVSKAKNGSAIMIFRSSLTVSAQNKPLQQGFNRKKKKKNDEQITAIKPITPVREKAIKYISFTADNGDIIKLETGEMGQAFKALRACTTELVSHWGINVELHETKLQPVRPKNNPSIWITADDYPRKALLREENAIIKFRLKVSDTGKAKECHIQRSIGDDSFDKTVCQKVMARARFEPALDKDGKPMTSYYISKVRFQILN